MKIDPRGISSVPLPKEKESGQRAEKSGRSFSASLSKANDDGYMERMGKLLDEITAQGEQLGQVPTYGELKKYRQLVQRFVGEAVGRMYNLQSQTGWDRFGRRKVYTLVKQIDESLSGLTEDVRQVQSQQLEIMGKLDAIRGMLVDLYT